MSESIRLTWLGHGSWLIEPDGYDSDQPVRLVLDPFLTDNPVAKIRPSELTGITHVLLSHAHFDHIADAAEICQANGATLVANFEIVQWFQKNHGIETAVGMNTGGSLSLPCGQLTLVPALHSSSFPDGSYGGCAGGFVLRVGSQRIYFACDTAFFSDMVHYAHGVDLAVLPIGDLFTMGADDSIAATKLIGPKAVTGAHYNTWPPIEQDVEHWALRVKNETNAAPVVLEVGGSWTVTGDSEVD